MTNTLPPSDERTTTTRRLPLRFSLRMLLLAVTAFAIGFPIWYRWPYEEEELRETKRNGQTELVGTGRFTTWQRQWGGGRKEHGPQRHIASGKLLSVTIYRNGKRTGPYTQYDGDGNVTSSGEFLEDERVGTWRSFDAKGRETATSEYRNGKRWRMRSVSADGIERFMEFTEAAKPARILAGGVEQEDRLARLAREGQIDDPRIAAAIERATTADMDFVNTHLKDAIDFIATVHELPILIDPHHVDLDQPITDHWRDIPLSTALTLIGATSGVSCEYRYGSLWLTSAEDAKDWKDPTGVAEIVPPPDSQLARSWNEPVKIDVIETPLGDALRFMVQPLALTIDTSQIPGPETGGYPILATTTLRGVKFRHALAILLYQTRCRCKLEGETLVILPPEESP